MPIPGESKRSRWTAIRSAHETVRAVNIFLIAYMLIHCLLRASDQSGRLQLHHKFFGGGRYAEQYWPGDWIRWAPVENFSICFLLSPKCVLIFDMLAGRLELFPLLILFAPSTWRRN